MLKISKIVHAARVFHGLDVVFISQFLGDRRVLRLVDAACQGEHTNAGDEAGPLQGPYSRLAGLPFAPGDADGMPITQGLPVGPHVGVPIRLSDGIVVGTLCCFRDAAARMPSATDLATLQAFADLAAISIEQDLSSERSNARTEQRIRTAIATLGPAIVFQPVFMLDGLRPVGAEALSRFPGHAEIPVDVWFKDAAGLGLQVELEICAIAKAIAQFRPVWARHRVQLGLNVSPATLLDMRLWGLLDQAPRDLVVLELTEHEEVRDYPALLEATTRLRRFGTKIAVDDVGAGFASMRHVLKLRPDILKLDLALTRSIDTDELKLALASSLKHFADHFDCRIVAEGVETPGELATLQKLGLQAAQGYLLGRPASTDDLLARFDRAAGVGVRGAA